MPDALPNHPAIPLHPEHPSARLPGAPAPLYASLRAFRSARDSLLNELEARYPDHFGKQGQPWAIGLREALIDALGGTYPIPLIRAALHHFSRSVRYLTNCALSGVGAKRLTLDGTHAGEVSRRELIFALTQLSGMVQRKDPEQAARYREWAMREMVLGLRHGDIDAEALAQAKVRKTVIRRATTMATDDAMLDTLKLRNKRSGVLHPAIYAMPYLPTNLQRAFQKRHPDHITTSKLRNKAKKAKAVGRPDGAGKAKRRNSPPILTPQCAIRTERDGAAKGRGARIHVKRRRVVVVQGEGRA